MHHYLRAATRRAREILEDGLSSVWVGGSVALDDYNARWSDIDAVLVSAQPLSLETKQQLARVLSHSVLPCPGRGLDLLVYARAALVQPARAPQVEMSLCTGADWREEATWGGPYPGGVIDLAILRAAGRAVWGPAPEDTIGELPRAWVAEEVRRSVAWHREHVHHPFHDPLGVNAVLNGARAWQFAVEGVLGSKAAAANWFLRRREQPLVAAALAARAEGQQMAKGAVLRFLDRTFEIIGAGPDSPHAEWT